jgi:hypothetical protein
MQTFRIPSVNPTVPVALTSNTTQRNTRFDMFHSATSERAHLIPDSPEFHKAYGFIAQAATGKSVDTSLDRLTLLSGVKKVGAARRPPGCGLKHHKFNKMYLERQGDFWDSNPPILVIVPIMELADVLDWNGTAEYDVMAISIGGFKGEECSETY